MVGDGAVFETAAALDQEYSVPAVRNDFAGILISLARQENPDMHPFNAPEVVWRMEESHHVGLVLRSDNPETITGLLDE